MFSSTLNPNSSAKQPADLNISQISSIGTPLDQSTPAFLFGKRKTASQANYANSPLNSASAPVSDIFAYPSSQGNIPQHVKDSTLASKSVHWSPSLIQSERGLSQSSQPSAPSTPSNIGISSVKSIVSPPSSYSSQAINAPPLRSLRDKIEPAKKVARRNTFAARSTTSSSNGIVGGAGASAKTTETPTLKFGGGGVTNDGGEQNEILNNKEQNQIEKLNGEVDAADTWVTVFGFQPSQISKLLNLFSRHGEVVSHQSPSKGNFVHIRYSCVTHAHQALSRNGTLLDSTTFIGVIPCTNKEVINGSATGIVSRSASMTNRSMSMYQSILENEELNQSILNNTHNHNENVLNSSTINFDANTSLNSSRISVRSGVGMRPLAADQRNNAISSNQKSDGLFNKLWSSIGLQ